MSTAGARPEVSEKEGAKGDRYSSVLPSVSGSNWRTDYPYTMAPC